jgi:hypothetical protein
MAQYRNESENNGVMKGENGIENETAMKAKAAKMAKWRHGINGENQKRHHQWRKLAIMAAIKRKARNIENGESVKIA